MEKNATESSLETIKFLSKYNLETLIKRFHLKAKRHFKYPELVQLKYDMIHSPLSNPIVQECRGLLLQEIPKTNEKFEYKVIAYPFKKFFNHNEPNASEIDEQSAVYYEKLDGSLCTLYYYDQQWHVASSGLPDAKADLRGKDKLYFCDLFWDIWNKNKMKLPSNTNMCYMFEMYTERNIIICRPKEEKIVLLGARELYEPYKEIRPEEIATKYGWECIPSYKFNSIKEAVEYSKKLNPINHEGYVVCDAQFRRIKIKSPQYVALAHLSPEDRRGINPMHMLEIVRTNEGSEFLAYFPEYKNLYKFVKEKYDSYILRLKTLYKDIASTSLDDIRFEKQAKEMCNDEDAKILMKMREKKIESLEEYLMGIKISKLHSLVFPRMKMTAIIEGNDGIIEITGMGVKGKKKRRRRNKKPKMEKLIEEEEENSKSGKKNKSKEKKKNQTSKKGKRK